MTASGREVYLEFRVQGAFVKVTAIDPQTGTEASIVGPSTAPRAALEQAALKKLSYIQTKKKP